jgi:hypothetical protein
MFDILTLIKSSAKRHHDEAMFAVAEDALCLWYGNLHPRPEQPSA